MEGTNSNQAVYIFDPRRRLPDVAAYRFLTSPWLLQGVILGMAIAAVLGIIALQDIPLLSVSSLGLAYLCGSIAGGLLLAFTFGSSFFPFRQPPKTVGELVGPGSSSVINVAQAASFDCIRHIGRHAKKNTSASLLDAADELLASHEVQRIVRRLGLSSEDVAAVIESTVIPSWSWEAVAKSVLDLAVLLDTDEIATEHAFGAFLLHPSLHAYLRQRGLRQQDVIFVLWWEVALRRVEHEGHRWWDIRYLLRFTGVGLSWASGYTPFIDQFARIPQGNVWDQPFGHMEQVEQLITTLARRRESNVLIVGNPGVGRLGVVKELARRVNQNRAHPTLNGQRVVYIHVGELLGLASSGAEQLAVVSQALREMERAGNIIAIFDGVSSILGQQGEGTTNLTDVLLPFFSSATVRVVVIMSSDEYHLRIASNEELLHFFDVVQVPPLTEEQTLQLLAVTAPQWERTAGIFVPYLVLREIVENTSSIMPQIPYPERAFDVLEEALAAAEAHKIRELAVDHVNTIISRKVGVDVGRMRGEERQHLLALEDIIHHRVVNQEQGVAAVARAMIRARAGVRNVERPIGVFLFLGPTGVGKTETSKALAEAYFGSEDYLQRLDMSEFQEKDGVSRLIGSQQVPTGRLTSSIADRPFTVLLLDEFEKAHRAVQQLFLQVFDEGHLTDVRGREYSFKHAIMIATSNAGAEFIRKTVEGSGGAVPENFEKQLREHVLTQGIFSPELLNRFDGVITFTPLSADHIRKIAELMLRKLNKRLDAEHGISIAVSPELIDYLVQIGYSPEFGARPMARAIQDTVEYAVARQIVEGKAEPGQNIVLNPQALQASQV